MLFPAPAAPVQLVICYSLHASVNWCSEPEPPSAMRCKHSDTFSSAALALIFIPPEGFQVFKLENTTLLNSDIQGRVTNSY